MISREELALRILCSHIQTGKATGPANVREAFALAMAFEEHSDKIGGRPERVSGRRRRDELEHDG